MNITKNHIPRLYLVTQQQTDRPYHIEQLAALCYAYPLHRKVLITPSLQTGANLAAALAFSGTSWLNVESSTDFDLALGAVASRMRDEGVTLLKPDRMLLGLEEMLQEILLHSEESMLSRIAFTPGLIRSFQRSILAMRQAGLPPDALDGAELEPARKTVLTKLYQRYVEWLVAEGLADDARVFELANETPLAAHADTVYAILDETPLSALAYRHVKRVAGSALYRIGRSDYGTVSPVSYALVRFPDAPYPEAPAQRIGTGADLFARGLKPEGQPPKLLRALGTENEVRAVLRDALTRNLPLDQIELVYTAESTYLRLIYDAVERFELEADFAVGVPVTLTRPGQAIIGFLRWCGSGTDARELVSLCRSGALSFRSDEAWNGISPSTLATLLQQERVTRGVASYRNMLARLEGRKKEAPKSLPGGVIPDERFTSSMRSLLEELLSRTPDTGHVTMAEVSAGCVLFLERFAEIRSPRDAAALESLVDRLTEIAEAVPTEAPASKQVQNLTDLLRIHKVGASTARPGSLYVTPLERSAYVNRRHLYIVGMDEGVFPGGADEDPVLLDHEREHLSGELELQRLRPREQTWHLIRALGMAVGNVTLLANNRHLADGREVYPSPLFLQAADVLTDGHPELIPMVTGIPDDSIPLDNAEAMLPSRTRSDFQEAVGHFFPDMAHGQAAALARGSHVLTRFDGLVENASLNLDAWNGSTVLSPSQLETLSSCPYRYYMRYVLRIEPPARFDEDTTQWLTPPEFGALLHDLFYEFMQKITDLGERPDTTKHTEIIQSQLDDQISVHRDRIPVLQDAAFNSDVRRLRAAANLFLAAETTRSHVEPVGFEVSFGFGESGNLRKPDPVILNLSHDITVALRGRIDRVDRTTSGIEIWDYKTGSSRSYSDDDLLNKGLHLQWALYAFAMEKILAETDEDSRIEKSGYFFISENEHGRRIGSVPPSHGAVADLLEPLVTLVSKGGFLRVTQGDPCRFCDYAPVCGEEMRIKAKDFPDLEVDSHPDIQAALERRLSG